MVPIKRSLFPDSQQLAGVRWKCGSIRFPVAVAVVKAGGASATCKLLVTRVCFEIRGCRCRALSTSAACTAH